MKIPLFPLQSVFYPGETVPLHIFEDRYKALIADCRREARTFGIPVYIGNTLSYGTEVQLAEIVNTYADGSMDVVCAARQVFRIRSFQPEMGDKPYPGGEVHMIEPLNDTDPDLKAQVMEGCQQLYALMQIDYEPIPAARFNSYTLAHKLGLSFQQEYELLKIARETDRLQYLLEHLQQTSRVLEQLNKTRERIEMNGHFRNFDPLDFKEFTLE